MNVKSILEIPIRNWNKTNFIDKADGKVNIRDTYKELKQKEKIEELEKQKNIRDTYKELKLTFNLRLISNISTY